MKDKPQIDPVEAAHLSRYSPEGIILKVGHHDRQTGEVIDEGVEVSGFAEKLTDEMLSGTFTVNYAPGTERSMQEFMEALRNITTEKARPMSASEAAAKAIGDWKQRNK